MTDMYQGRAVHQWLKDVLADRNLNQVDIARAWGVDQAGISRLISDGSGLSVTTERLETLSALVGIPKDELERKFRENGTSVKVVGNGAVDTDDVPRPMIQLTKALAIAAMFEAIEVVKSFGITVKVQLEA
jgi:DNA-binding Xre family transcriptional regulator